MCKKHISNITQLSLIRNRFKDKTIILGSGCFDLLHAGHIAYLSAAKELGDILVLGINSDTSIRQIKGKCRPIFPVQERIRLLESLSYVDFIFVFEDIDICKAMEFLSPDIFATNSESLYRYPCESAYAQNHNIKTVCIDRNDELSTTQIIHRIIKANLITI